ncbi:MAG: hydantoinase/oxoprolinase family protein [Chloroflexi bacterium]|nr:hydantoinase/oxoprolinase family protein [Chloroflexota bacterium]
MTTDSRTYRLGVDIGGTFTDAMLIDEQTGEIRIGKVPSTPRDPSIGFLNATERMLRTAQVAPEAISYVVHGTTVATNAIIEGKGARTGFITTQGFRDILEIQRQIRPVLYDVMFDKPKPLVPRYLAHQVPERLDAFGNVLRPLDEEAVRQAARKLKAENVEAIAVCFLHSYVNGAHERRAAEIILEEFPEVVLSVSSEVAPEFREYFRASTTVINASVRPVVKRYLESIGARLRAQGLRAELLVMQSSGGVLTFATASEKPVFMVESGPAAGVIASTYLGGILGNKDVISFDMGGTTAKVGLIQNGQPRITKDYEVGATAKAGGGAGRGSGYPIRTPVIDLVEIGAGGGSIAWVDPGGVLRVGPHSAGAEPGPVCYGQGGTEPTITDANLVLGRLDPRYFLGGEMSLDVDAARRAIEEKCARPLGLDVLAAANGIIEIANAAMINALRLISVQRGYDPREFVLVGFGGAGPVHANRLAAEMSIPRTIIPPAPGIFSAMGLLVTDLKHDYSVTRIRRTDKLDYPELTRSYDDMMAQGRAMLEREEVPAAEMSFHRQVDMRYVGQSYELTIPVPAGELSAESIARVVEQFHREHDRAYGYAAPAEPTEFVNLRLTAMGNINKPTLREIPPAGPEGAAPALHDRRPVYFAEADGFVDCPIYLRYKLGSGAVVEGPAIVEEMDSTTVLHPGFRATADRYGNLLITPNNKNS